MTEQEQAELVDLRRQVRKLVEEKKRDLDAYFRDCEVMKVQIESLKKDLGAMTADRDYLQRLVARTEP